MKKSSPFIWILLLVVGCITAIGIGLKKKNDQQIIYNDFLTTTNQLKEESKYKFIDEETVLEFALQEGLYNSPWSYVKIISQSKQDFIGLRKHSKNLRENKKKIRGLFSNASTVKSDTVKFVFHGELNNYALNHDLYRLVDVYYLNAPRMELNGTGGAKELGFAVRILAKDFPIEGLQIKTIDGSIKWKEKKPESPIFYEEPKFSKLYLKVESLDESEVCLSELKLTSNNRSFTYHIRNYGLDMKCIRVE